MPTYCHTDISAMVGRAVISLPSNGASTMPHNGFRMSRQRKPTMTTDNVAGMNSNAR